MVIGKIENDKDIHNVESASEVIVVTELDKWEEAKDAFWRVVSEKEYFKGLADAYENIVHLITKKGETE